MRKTLKIKHLQTNLLPYLNACAFCSLNHVQTNPTSTSSFTHDQIPYLQLWLQMIQNKLPVTAYLELLFFLRNFEGIASAMPSKGQILQLTFLICLSKTLDHENHFRPSRSLVRQLLQFCWLFKMFQELLIYPLSISTYLYNKTRDYNPRYK